MTSTTTLRVVLDVNVLLDTLLATGPISCLEDLAGMHIPAKAGTANARRVVRAVAKAALAGSTDMTVHIAPHVWAMTARKLVRPTLTKDGVPAYEAWTAAEARETIAVLWNAFKAMAVNGWTCDAQNDTTRENLRNIVPVSFYGGKYDIDNEDRTVLLGALAAAKLPARNNAPVMTVLVTNDGGLQAASEWVASRYQSTNGETLPQSFTIMFPSMTAALIDNYAAAAAA
jgi:hypothetical protein